MLKTTNLRDEDIHVTVALRHVIKANKAFIEVKFSRNQIKGYETVIAKKDSAFNKLLEANRLLIEVNKEREAQIGAYRVKSELYDELAKDYEKQLKKANRQALALKIGTPVLIVSVGVLCGVGGFYLNKAIK